MLAEFFIYLMQPMSIQPTVDHFTKWIIAAVAVNVNKIVRQVINGCNEKIVTLDIGPCKCLEIVLHAQFAVDDQLCQANFLKYLAPQSTLWILIRL